MWAQRSRRIWYSEAFLVVHSLMITVWLLQGAALALYLSITESSRVQLSGWLDIVTDVEISILVPVWMISMGLFSLCAARRIRRRGRVGTISLGIQLFLILVPFYGLSRWKELSRRGE